MRRNWRGLRLAGDGSKNPTALTRTRTWLALSCVAHPIPGPGSAASGPVAGIRELTSIQRQAAAADAFGERRLEPLELRDPRADPLRPVGGQLGPVLALGRAVLR